EVDQHAVAGDAGVVDGDVEPAPGAEGGVQQPVGARGGRDVAAVGHGVAAGGPQVRDHRVDRRGVDVVDHDPGAGGGQRLDVGPADALGGTGDGADAPLTEPAHARCQATAAGGVA